MIQQEENMLLDGKVAIVTGGAQGIGRGIAVKFASEGCGVAIADIDIKEANATLSEIKQKGGKAIAIKCDAASGEQVGLMVREVVQEFAKIDILVNNAGGLPSTAPVDEMSEDEWDKVIALNLKSVFLCCKYVVPHMKKNKYGKIINISSLGATFPPPSNLHTHSGTAGLLGMTRDLAAGLSEYRINVNAILPGPIRPS